MIFSINLLVFLEALTHGFITEYDVGPNHLFVEYLKYPNEVIPMLWGGFNIHVFASLGFVALTVWIMRRFMQIYLSLSGRQFNWQNRLRFQLYDSKFR